MNIKMVINSQLSTIELKKNKANKQNRNRIIDTEITWRDISWEGGRGRESLGEKDQGLRSTNW